MENEEKYIEFAKSYANEVSVLLELDENAARLTTRDTLVCIARMTIQQANEIVEKAGL